MKNRKFQGHMIRHGSIFIFLIGLFFIFVFLIVPVCEAGSISDRVAAFVDDEAITNSELNEQYAQTLKAIPEITIVEVLDAMINRVLILREAKKYRLEGPSDDEVIKEYIDLKMRAFIRLPEAEIEKYYLENSGMFNEKEFEDVRDDIEQFLTEKELNARLKEALREFRKTAYIKILSNAEQSAR